MDITDDIRKMVPANDNRLKINGIGRDAEYDKALILTLNRRPTDDEMRFIQDRLNEELA